MEEDQLCERGSEARLAHRFVGLSTTRALSMLDKVSNRRLDYESKSSSAYAELLPRVELSCTAFGACYKFLKDRRL